MGKGNRRTISITVDDFEYNEIEIYAKAKGHGGQTPASAFAHYAVFQQMKKYPLSEAERAKYSNHTKMVIEAPRLHGIECVEVI